MLGKAQGRRAGLEGKGLAGMHGARGRRAAARRRPQAGRQDPGRGQAGQGRRGHPGRSTSAPRPTSPRRPRRARRQGRPARSRRARAPRASSFEDYVGKRMDAYKDDRYSGILGAGQVAQGQARRACRTRSTTSTPRAATRYLADMDAVIGKVADVVGGELTAARAAHRRRARPRSRKYVAQLPQDLQKVGKEAEAKLDGQFDQLSSDVDSKQDELVDTLARKYVESRDALDARIDEMKAANRGLVDKAIDAVEGVDQDDHPAQEHAAGRPGQGRGRDRRHHHRPDRVPGQAGRRHQGGPRAGSSATSPPTCKKGLMGWLFGALGEAGIQLPKTLRPRRDLRPGDAGPRPHLPQHPRPRGQARRRAGRRAGWSRPSTSSRCSSPRASGRPVEVDQGQGRRPRGDWSSAGSRPSSSRRSSRPASPG